MGWFSATQWTKITVKCNISLFNMVYKDNTYTKFSHSIDMDHFQALLDETDLSFLDSSSDSSSDSSDGEQMLTNKELDTMESDFRLLIADAAEELSQPVLFCLTEGCTRRAYYRFGGSRSHCSQHGGTPFCAHPGCSSRVARRRGGDEDMCITHGGSATCRIQGCESAVKFTFGGKRGRCRKHGGAPTCSHNGCPYKTSFMRGGIHGRCKTHGGSPKCSTPCCNNRMAIASKRKCKACAKL